MTTKHLQNKGRIAMKNENENVIDSGWRWSTDRFCYDSDVFATRDAVIEDAHKKIGTKVPFYIIFCELVRLNIKDFIGSAVETAINNSLHLSDYRDSPFDDIPLDATHDLDKMVGEACDAWQNRHKLEFSHFIFDEDTSETIGPDMGTTKKVQQ